MATATQIEQLRRMINDTVTDDTTLGARIDSFGGNLDATAADFWEEKAASYAAFVNVKEGSSSRDLGSLYKNAMEMAKFYGSGGADVNRTNVARTRPAVREGGF